MTRVLRFFAALPGPLLVGLCVWNLGQTTEVWTPHESVLKHDEKLKKVQPQVVVVGPSIVNADVDEAQLSKELGMPVAAMAELGTPGAVWYALLKYRVFEAGYKPSVVVVLGLPYGMLQTQPDTGDVLQRLLRQAPVLDEEIQERTFHGGGGVWERHQDAGRAWMASLLADFKYRSVGLVFDGSFDVETGKAMAEEAASEVFETGTTHNVRAQALVPGNSLPISTKAEVPDVESSYLKPIVALSKAHGATVLFVAGPTASAAVNRCPIPRDVERRMVEFLNTLGGGWIDLRLPVFKDDLFKDDVHLKKDGRTLFTHLLAEAIKDSGALKGKISPARVPNLPSRIARIGTPIDLHPGPVVQNPRYPCGLSMTLPEWTSLSSGNLGEEELGGFSPIEVLAGDKPLQWSTVGNDVGAKCAGAFIFRSGNVLFSRQTETQDGPWSLRWAPDFPLRQPNLPEVYWLYPGNTLEIDFDNAWPTDIFAIQLVVSLFGGQGGQPRLKVGDEQWPLQDWDNNLRPPPPQKAWQMSITVPKDGPVVAVRQLALGDGKEQDWVIGNNIQSTLHVYNPQSKSTYDTPPQPLEVGTHSVNAAGLDLLSLPSERQWPEAMQKLVAEMGCWPATPTVNGKALPPQSKAALQKGALGYTRQIGEIAYRAEAGATVETAVVPNCLLQRWVYPGNPQHTLLVQRQLQLMRQRPKGLLLTGWQLGPGHLNIKVLMDNQPFLEKVISTELLSEQVEVDFPRWVPWDTRQLEVILWANEGEAPIFLSSVDLLGSLDP